MPILEDTQLQSIEPTFYNKNCEELNGLKRKRLDESRVIHRLKQATSISEEQQLIAEEEGITRE